MTATADRAPHWNHIYSSHASDELTWFQQTPHTSLQLLHEAGASPAT